MDYISRRVKNESYPTLAYRSMDIGYSYSDATITIESVSNF